MKLSCFSLQVVLFACVCGFVFYTSQGVASVQIGNGIFCGSNLVSTMELVCRSHYNKRYDADSYEFSNNAQPSNALERPYLGHNSPISLLVKRATFLRKARGIIDECCIKSCDYDVLVTYCSNPPNRISSSQGMANDFQDLAFS